MALGGLITVVTVFFCVLLGPLNQAPANGSSLGRMCCTSYTRSPIPVHRITGFKEQTLLENCDIEAIIFYTVKKNKICATQKDEWVRRTLNLLSVRLKKMSKARPAVGNNMKKMSGRPLTHHTSGIFSTTEGSQNVTQSSTTSNA